MDRRRKIFLALMCLWMICIFAFSARSGDESTDDSYLAGRVVGELFVPGFDEWNAEKQQKFVEKIDHPVRKTAHAAEYAILGILAAGACITTKKKGWKTVLFPWGIATAYAVTDEFHQLFVPGRSGQMTDVMIDSGGALVGLLALHVIRMFIENRKLQRNKKQSAI